MNFRQLILRNVLGNRRTYGAYFISSLFAVFIFYIFTMLLFHSQMQGNLSYSDNISLVARVGLSVALVVIALLSLVFLWYTFVSFLKRRKRDLALYQVLGISGKDLRKLLFFENTCLGLLATISGISLGIIFSKVMLLIAQNLMVLKNGLRFEVPLVSVLLTLALYSFLFVVISFVSTRRVQTKDISGQLKEDEKPRPEPKARWYLVALGLVTLLGGYGIVLGFASEDMSFLSLLFGTLLTIAGTFLLFYQVSVFALKALKKSPRAFKQTNLLFFSEMIFKMRDNAMMYSLIAITAAVAFVGISVMMAVGNRSFSDVSGPSFAYMVYGTREGYEKSGTYGNELMTEITEDIKTAGFQPTALSVNYTNVSLPNGVEEAQANADPLFSGSGLTLMNYTTYQELCRLMEVTPIKIQQDEILFLSGSASRSNQVKATPAEKLRQDYQIAFGNQTENMTIVYTPQTMVLNLFALSVVTDETYQEIMAADGLQDSVGIIDYQEWADDGELSDSINQFLAAESTAMEQAYDRELRQYSREELDAMTPEEFETAIPSANQQIHYLSKYQVFQENRQGNGTILMITVLLGAVFFIFAASILYFRLFADLEKDGAYHHALFQLGVSEKERHKIVRQQMRVMYFLPAVVAMLHFSVAMVALRLLVDLPVWEFYGQIVGCYLIFQISFYLICKNRYLLHLDQLADRLR